MSEVARRFGLRGPLVVAPLGGGPTTPALVAACSNAGALGSLAGAYLEPDALTAAIRETRARTPRPFAVNLFARPPEPAVSPDRLVAALTATRPFRAELSLPEPSLRPPYHPDFDRQLERILRECDGAANPPAAFSFVFGIPDAAALGECRRRGLWLLGNATTVDEGRALEAAGVDAVVAQGTEAGGHHGLFDPDAPDPGTPTLELVRALVAEIRLPVIAAGGLMDGTDVHRALRVGASAAQLGTAFLACDEAGTAAAYRAALLDPARPRTVLTRAFSGRWARGLQNRFVTELIASDAVLPFPAQNALTRDIRREAATRGRAEFLSLWAGTGVARLRTGAAAELVTAIYRELDESLQGSAGNGSSGRQNTRV